MVSSFYFCFEGRAKVGQQTVGHTDITIKKMEKKQLQVLPPARWTCWMLNWHIIIYWYSSESALGFGCYTATPMETIHIVNELSKPSGTKSL